MAAAVREIRRSCRPARSCRCARRLRSTCCRSSAGLPSTSRGWRSRHIRPHSRSRRRRRCSAMIARMTSFAVTLRGSVPSIEIRIVFGFFSQTVWVASDVAKLVAAADRHGERATGAIGRGVGIVAGDQHAGLREAELRRDHMRDALVADGTSRHAAGRTPWRSRPASRRRGGSPDWACRRGRARG